MIANRFIHCRNFHDNTPSYTRVPHPNFPAPAAHPHSLQSTITNQPWKSHNLATGGKTSDHRDKFSGLAHSPTATYETRARKGSSRDNQGCEMNYDDGCKPRILRRRQVPERNRKIHSGSHLDAVGKSESPSSTTPKTRNGTCADTTNSVAQTAAAGSICKIPPYCRRESKRQVRRHEEEWQKNQRSPP